MDVLKCWNVCKIKKKKQPLALKSLGKIPEVRYEKSVPSFLSGSFYKSAIVG